MATLEIRRQTIIGLIALCVSIEVALQLSDLGVIGNPRLRQTVYEYGGFWPGLLDTWLPNFDGQRWSMFFTYSFLHGGLVHLVVNMLTLWSLSPAVINRVGARGFIMLYGTAVLGGACGYALLSSDYRPMVGASGALFGLAGGVLAWTYVDRYTRGQGLWPVLQAVVLLLALNLILMWGMDGQLAWQTHLGGFVAGWVFALLIDPTPRDRPS